MKYLCLIYFEEETLQALSESKLNAIATECLEYEEELEDGGQFIAAEALEPVQTATTVRVGDGKVSVTDGPFAETKEQLGGFFLITARDLNEAIRIASKLPQAPLGSIEVRPIRELQPE